MRMKESNDRILQSKYIKGRKRSKNDFKKDRRSGIDRRKVVSSEYFKKGGVERRSWKERRHLWYMTM